MYKHFDTVPNFKLSFRFRLQENVKHVCDKEIFEPAWKQRIHYGAPCLDKSLRYNVKVSSGNILFCIYSSVIFTMCHLCANMASTHISPIIYVKCAVTCWNSFTAEFTQWSDWSQKATIIIIIRGTSAFSNITMTLQDLENHIHLSLFR